VPGFRQVGAHQQPGAASLSEALVGSDRPLVITSAASLTPGRLATEGSAPDPGSFAALRFASERRRCRSQHAACACRWCGSHRRFTVRVITASSRASLTSRARGVSDIPGRWVQPLARRAPARRRASVPAGSGGGSCGRATARVGEEGVPVRDIAEVIGRHVQLPATAISTEEEAGLASRAARTHPGPRRRPLLQGLVGLERTSPISVRGARPPLDAMVPQLARRPTMILQRSAPARSRSCPELGTVTAGR
jgi:hypothetical protein